MQEVVCRAALTPERTERRERAAATCIRRRAGGLARGDEVASDGDTDVECYSSRQSNAARAVRAANTSERLESRRRHGTPVRPSIRPAVAAAASINANDLSTNTVLAGSGVSIPTGR